MAGRMDSEHPQGLITVAVIVGDHAYDVPGFRRLLAAMPTLDCYVQDLHNFAADAGDMRTKYDVLLFYNFHWATPTAEDPDWRHHHRLSTLEMLGQNAQGIFVWHHALAAFPEWTFWSDLTGIPPAVRAIPQDITYVGGQVRLHQALPIEVVDREHPITRGLEPWILDGETWGDLVGDPGPDSHLLLHARHPLMEMTAMAWTRQFGQARVFCLQPGHDAGTWDDANFRTIFERACHWLVGSETGP